MGVGIILVTPPSVEPMTLAEAKLFLRVDSTSEDGLIESLISAARIQVENFTGRCMITQTWDQWLDRFFEGSVQTTPWWDGTREGAVSTLYGGGSTLARELRLLKSPVSAVTISSFGVDDTETTFDSSNYLLDDSQVTPRVVLRNGATWPTDLREVKALKFRMTCGHGATAASVPMDMITAVKQTLAHWYENRESVNIGNITTELPQHAKMILEHYRVYNL